MSMTTYTKTMVLKIVGDIIAEQIDVDRADVIPSASLIDDLGADSLNLIAMVLAIEERFEIDIADEQTERVLTVQDAADLVIEILGPRVLERNAGATK